MAKLSHIVEYSLATAFMKVMSWLPRSFGDRLARGLGSMAFRVWGSRRRIAVENIERALGKAVSNEQVQRIARAAFQNTTRTFVDIAHFVHTPADAVRRMVIANEGDEREILELSQSGKGMVFVTAHYGNWEILGMWAAAIGLPMNVVAGIQHNSLVDRMVTRLREKMGVRVIKADRKGSLEVVRALKNGEAVGIVADQHAAVAPVIVNFFGRPVAAPKGPAAFAIRAGCPVWPFVSRRERYDRHIMMPGDPIYPEPGRQTDVAIEEITRQYTDFFEEMIRKHPEQWMWTHRRWKLRDA